jgi:hypothetical protein
MILSEALRDIATIISLSLTVPTVAGCIAVLFLWGNSALKAYRRSHKTETDWFILGVFVGFLGGAIDNSYWGLAWSADFTHHYSKNILFENGVYPNVFFRQICGAIAAACHVRAAVETDSLIFRTSIVLPWFFGLLVAVYLFSLGEIGV